MRRNDIFITSFCWLWWEYVETSPQTRIVILVSEMSMQSAYTTYWMIVISAIKLLFQFSFFFLLVNRRYIPHLKNNWSLHYCYIVTSTYMYNKYISSMSILVNISYVYYISHIFSRHNQRTNYILIFQLILKLHVRKQYKATSLCSYSYTDCKISNSK